MLEQQVSERVIKKGESLNHPLIVYCSYCRQIKKVMIKGDKRNYRCKDCNTYIATVIRRPDGSRLIKYGSISL
jgi:tRNA(Ile2) C34 agmatinyltransferase TiaS